MQRYFVSADQFHESTVEITGEDAHHIVRVMRSEIGDEFICSDGMTREALVKVIDLSKDKVIAEIVEQLPWTAEPPIDVWIAQSLPKGDKLETVIQKGTEIGAASFLPFVSERTVVQYDGKKEAKRLERWQKIAKEAAEQAHRNRIPEVLSPVSWKALLKQAAECDAAWICYEKESGLDFRSLVRATANKAKAMDSKLKVMLIIGPEGGFSEREIEEAIAAGCHSVSLGKRILRTETAALVGLSCILYELGEMGG